MGKAVVGSEMQEAGFVQEEELSVDEEETLEEMA
jgi:hypothetical protein